MKLNLKQINNFNLQGTNHKHNLFLDASPDIGGEDKGFRPMELVAFGLASCSSMDLISILKKAKINYSDFEIEIECKRRAEIPKVFTDIHLTISLRIIDQNLTENKMKKWIELSIYKYCSVVAMLEKVSVTYSLILNQ